LEVMWLFFKGIIFLKYKLNLQKFKIYIFYMNSKKKKSPLNQISSKVFFIKKKLKMTEIVFKVFLKKYIKIIYIFLFF
jgi:hypothetical protein